MQPVKKIKILFVEDLPTDYDLARREIKKGNIEFEDYRVETEEKFLEALEIFKPDIIISDYSMPEFDGLQVIIITKEYDPLLPVVILTGSINEFTAVECIKSGAVDYVLKENMTRLPIAVDEALRLKQLKHEGMETQKALTESEERFRNLYEKAPIGLYRTTPEGKIISANQALFKMLGYSSFDELATRNLEQDGFESPYDRKKFISQIESQGEIYNMEARWTCYDGNIIVVKESAVAIRDANGKTLYYDGTIEDITERKRMEEELIKSKEDAEIANKLKSTLLANMSHEFRTPLNGILGFTKILRDELAGSVLTEMTEKIEKSGRRLLNTLNSILTVMELENDEYYLTKTYIDLRNFCETIRNDFQEDALDKNLGLRLELDQSIYIIETDQNVLSKIVGYLVNNAIKYTNEGEVVIKTTKCTDESGINEIRILVIDTGIGIKKEDQKVIFKEFKQVSEGFSRNFEGSGLGLTLAQKMAHLIDAEIIVESALGKGSAFSIVLPQRETGILKLPQEKEELVDFTTNKSIETDKPLHDILIVEDNSLNAELVQRYLSRIGTVDIARDGVTAINMAELKQYELLLIDINLGQSMNGIEVLCEIKKNENYKDVPSIALTGYASSASKREFLSRGFNDYLAKPFDKKDLLNSINKLFLS